jgi:vitamin B12 transporter
MKLLKLTFQFVFTAIVSINNLFAQNIADSLYLPEIVITEKTADREIRSTTPFQILSNDRIQALNALQLSDAVKHFSGVTVKDYGGIGGLKTISVRGLGASHTGISYNGLEVTDLQSGQIDIGRFSLDNIESVTLNNGQNDNIFLPAKAFASASGININSKTPEFKNKEKLNGSLSVKGGSFGLFNPAMNSSIKFSDKIAATFSSELTLAKGNYPYILHYGDADRDSSSIEQRQNSDVKNLRLETGLYADFSQDTKGYISLYYYQSERGLPGATIFYNTQGFSKQRLWDNTFFTQGHLEHTFSRKWIIQVNAKYNKGYLKYLDPTYLGIEGEIKDIFTQNELYGSIAALYRALENVSFSFSNDITNANMHSNRKSFAAPSRLTSQSVVAAKWVSEEIMATSSLLYTHTFESVKNGNAAKNRIKLTPHISISVKPFNNIDLRFRAFYKNSFRLPTFNDLYYPSIGYRDLKPEDANQFNFGITYSNSSNSIKDNLFNNLTLSADAYHNRVNNKIIAYPSGNLHQWTMLNMGKVHINGVDFSAECSINITQNSPITLGVSYTFQRSVDKTNPDKSTWNHQIPYTPLHSGSSRALFQLPWLNIAYTLIWSGDRYTNAYNSKEFRIAGYADHSVSLSKGIKAGSGNLNFSIEALNLSGKNYEIILNYPMPGRSYRWNISYNF